MQRPRSLATLLLLSVLGCDVEADPEVASPRDETDIIMENLRAAGFPAEEIEIRASGEVLVGGDAVVTLEASYELAGVSPGGEGFRHYRTTNLVTDDVICVDGSALGGTELDALEGAIRRYNGQGLSFEMRLTSGSEPDCDTVIDVQVVDGTGGEAGFPSGGHAYSTIKLGDDVYPTYGKKRYRHLVMHELGHAVGFRHTDYYDRSISCGSGGNEGSAGVGAHHIANTPTTATTKGSIMNACYWSTSEGEWKDNDITALDELYGVSFCDAFDGRTIALVSDHGRWVRARDSGSNWRLYQRSDQEPDTEFVVECTNDDVWLETTHGRYVSPRDSSDNYYVRQSSGWDSDDALEPSKSADGRWELKTRFNRYIRARGSGNNWRVEQSSNSQGTTRFDLHLLD